MSSKYASISTRFDKWTGWDLIPSTQGVHPLYVLTKRESFIVYSLPFRLTVLLLVASRIDDMNEKKMITPAKGEPTVYKVF